METGRKILNGTGHVHLYFIIIIFQLYFLFPVLIYMMKRWSKTVLAFSFILTLLFQTGLYLKMMKIISFPEYILPDFMVFPTCIFYFSFGIYFAMDLEKKRDWIYSHTTLLAIVWAGSILLLVMDSKLTNTFSTSTKPTLMLYSTTTFLLLYSVTLKLKDSKLWLLNILDWISKQSFLIYFSHLLVLKVIILLTRQPSNTGIWIGFRGMLAIYAACVLCTCLFTHIVSYTPAASILGGANKVKKKEPSGSVAAGM
jgi:surface polysaccharide O-acyltransferase-like enzyme